MYGEREREIYLLVMMAGGLMIAEGENKHQAMLIYVGESL